MKNFDLTQGREQLADAMWQRWLALNGAIALPPPSSADKQKAQKG